MTEYIPTTDQIESDYCYERWDLAGVEGPEARAEFARWFKQVKADSYDKRYEDGIVEGSMGYSEVD